ncbi:MAG: hypothetical protein D3920_16695, partial [Candidatus Electrothrix sp. AW2]|nr:hypothetical protein [Candidatus Electrothrix gigas]
SSGTVLWKKICAMTAITTIPCLWRRSSGRLILQRFSSGSRTVRELRWPCPPESRLDRKKRQELLRRSRQHWQDATLLFISHDIDEALAFDRVLVVEDGQIIEDDTPERLANDPDSRYSALRQSEQEIQRKLHDDPCWRHWVMEKGRLKEGGGV